MRSHILIFFESILIRSPTFIGSSFKCSPPYTSILPVTDVTTDLVFEIVEEHSLRKDVSIGQVITPLPLLTEMSPSPLSQSFRSTYWVDIFPSDYDKQNNTAGLYYHRFPSAVNRIPGTGMMKPRVPLGSLYVSFHLQLFKPLMMCYIINDTAMKRMRDIKGRKKKKGRGESSAGLSLSDSATRATTATDNGGSGIETSKSAAPRVGGAAEDDVVEIIAGGKSSTLDISHNSLSSQPRKGTTKTSGPGHHQQQPVVKMHLPTFKRNVRRLQLYYSQPPAWIGYLRSVIHWESPLLSLLSLFIYYGLCFNTRPHHLPLLFLFLLVLIGLASHHTHQATEEQSVIAWENESLPSEYAKEGALKKYKRWKGIIGRTTYVMGSLASRMEKMSNALAWTDPHLSAALYLLLLGCTIVLTVLLYFVHISVVIFAVGVAVMMRGLVDKLKEAKWKQGMEEKKGGGMDEAGNPGASSTGASALVGAESASGLATVSPVSPVSRKIRGMRNLWGLRRRFSGSKSGSSSTAQIPQASSIALSPSSPEELQMADDLAVGRVVSMPVQSREHERRRRLFSADMDGHEKHSTPSLMPVPVAEFLGSSTGSKKSMSRHQSMEDIAGLRAAIARAAAAEEDSGNSSQLIPLFRDDSDADNQLRRTPRVQDVTLPNDKPTHSNSGDSSWSTYSFPGSFSPSSFGWVLHVWSIVSWLVHWLVEGVQCLRLAFAHLYARIPDHEEFAHRIIARKAVTTSPNNLPTLLLSSSTSQPYNTQSVPSSSPTPTSTRSASMSVEQPKPRFSLFKSLGNRSRREHSVSVSSSSSNASHPTNLKPPTLPSPASSNTLKSAPPTFSTSSTSSSSFATPASASTAATVVPPQSLLSPPRTLTFPFPTTGAADQSTATSEIGYSSSEGDSTSDSSSSEHTDEESLDYL